jgi:hypothetical protein
MIHQSHLCALLATGLAISRVLAADEPMIIQA